MVFTKESHQKPSGKFPNEFDLKFHVRYQQESINCCSLAMTIFWLYCYHQSFSMLNEEGLTILCIGVAVELLDGEIDEFHVHLKLHSEGPPCEIKMNHEMSTLGINLS